MRVTFDKLSDGRSFPLSRGSAKRVIDALVPSALRPWFTKVHFGCNRASSQEARLAGRGSTYEIRVNFWLEGATSRVVSPSPQWVGPVRRAGGEIDSQLERVTWPGSSAQRYAAFLLAHEVAHAVYAQEHGLSVLGERAGGPAEESWCDRWANEAIAKLDL